MGLFRRWCRSNIWQRGDRRKYRYCLRHSIGTVFLMLCNGCKFIISPNKANMKHKIFLVLFALLFFIPQLNSVSSSGLTDSPWPMFHGNPQHTGLSSSDTNHVDGTVLWSFESGAGIESSPAIGSDGTVYIGSTDHKFYTFSGSPPVGTIYPPFNFSGKRR